MGVAYPGVYADKYVLDSCLTYVTLNETQRMLLLQPVVVLPRYERSTFLSYCIQVPSLGTVRAACIISYLCDSGFWSTVVCCSSFCFSMS